MTLPETENELKRLLKSDGILTPVAEYRELINSIVYKWISNKSLGVRPCRKVVEFRDELLEDLK